MVSKSKRKQKENEDLEALKHEADVDFHFINLDSLLQRLGTDIKTGLTSSKAMELLQKNGPNQLTPPKRTSEVVKFLKALFTGFSILLEVGAILCLIAYAISYAQDHNTSQDNLWLGIVLIMVVLITGIFTYYQESKSNKIMDSFKKMIPQESIVLRDGKKINISAERVVVGDIVMHRGGDRICADLRVIEASSFKVDNSSLTGESEPQKRTPECTNENLLETSNMAFAYTYSVEGTCTGVVVATGDNTVMGRIAKLTSSMKSGKTPIGIEIEKFIRLITIIAFFIGIVFFILSLTVTRNSFIKTVIFFIGIIVANVPEGLLLGTTVTLSLTARILADKYCLIKNLESVETLGSTSVICSDKTGTLTQNRMTVSHIWIDNCIQDIDTSEKISRATVKGNSKASNMLLKIAAICNRAEFRDDQDFNVPILRWTTNGDASESALLKYVELFGGPAEDIRNEYKKVFEIPFNSVNKYQVSVHEQLHRGDYLVVMKGAPERIIKMCKSILINDCEKSLEDQHLNDFNKANEEMGGMGERVLGFCYYYLGIKDYPRGCKLADEDQPCFSMDNFCFVGLASMVDPPRAAVPHAVELCRSAGIKVIMVTGDHPTTAAAIAKNVGIFTGKVENFSEFKSRLDSLGYAAAYKEKNISAVITGNDIKDMTPEFLDDVIKYHHEIVFARTSPQQKLVIVEGFQRSGAIVAVTGDGVNDSPALRKADIGIAMGIAGSDVAKQAADMILLDDNFASIVTGVEQGRIIFDNLKKSIAYTLTSNIPEITPFILNILAGIPLPLSTITILCIDLGTDMIPAISLAYEKAEMDIMKRKPRNPKVDSLVNMILINYSYLLVGVFQAVAAFIVYLFIMLDNGFTFSSLRVYDRWGDPNVPFIIDSFGQEWPYLARLDLEYTCSTGGFITIVIVQIADLIISKTRTTTIFRQGICSNKMLLFGIFSEILLLLIVTYVEIANKIFQTRPVHPFYLFPAFFFCFLLWFIDECRRFHIRRNPGGFIQKETYY